MPPPLVGRRFGIQKILTSPNEQYHGIKALGIIGSYRQQPALSTIERSLLIALQSYRDRGCTTAFLKLKDLTLHGCEGNLSKDLQYSTNPCQITLKDEDDGVQKVNDTVLGFYVPEVTIESWMGENDEDTTKDWGEVQKNLFTQEKRDNLNYNSLILAISLKSPCEANADLKNLKDRGGSD